ncbi:MAG: hypothetical protein JWM93_554 [Frankiales bacterium]|nr:hypothetical protein [Frankiales bacterium]
MTTTSTLTGNASIAAALPHLDLRSTRHDFVSLGTALRSDYLKLTSLRSTRAITWLVAFVGAFASWAVATLIKDEVLIVAEVFVFSSVLTAVFAAVSGILLFTSEAQHGTLAATLTAQPARWVVAASKALMAAGRGLTLGLIGMAAAFAGGVVGGLEIGPTATMASDVAWGAVFTTVAALLGLGVGMIVRHGSGSISGLLVWWLLVENLFTLFLPAEVARFLPFFAGNNLLGIVSDTTTPAALAVALTRTQDAFVFGSYAAVALTVGTVLLYRRDTN